MLGVGCWVLGVGCWMRALPAVALAKAGGKIREMSGLTRELRYFWEMNQFVLGTERLLLRELTPGDALLFYQLNEDPEVIRYTGDRAFRDEEEARVFLQAYDQYRLYGYGRWAVIRRSDRAFLGWCGLKYSPNLSETDLGFRLFRAHWGQGYGTEAAAACLRYGLLELKLPLIVGRVQKENLASIRVLEKIGMVYWKEFLFDGATGLYYRTPTPFVLI